MGNIVVLDELTINKIAAGEVIERPSSVIKEMVENSIDAGAKNINIEIKNGGISYIRITDDGKGIEKEDLELSFERHATSKIRQAEDLNDVKSMGFRGEALASIAAIARVEMQSKTQDEEIGNKIVVEGGSVLELEECGCPNGTTITVENLFYNTPVRYKFLKKDYTETGYIEDVITRLALVHPEIAFKLINQGKTIIQTVGDGDMKNVIYSIYGKTVATACLNVNYTYEGINVTGVVGKPEIARSNRGNQIFFVNKRYIKDRILSNATEKAFKGMIPIGKFGFLVLNLEMAPNAVDVNVHPAKLEVRFEEEQKVFKAMYYAIQDTLLKAELIANSETQITGKLDKDKDKEKEEEPIPTQQGNVETMEKIEEEEEKSISGLFRKIAKSASAKQEAKRETLVESLYNSRMHEAEAKNEIKEEPKQEEIKEEPIINTEEVSRPIEPVKNEFSNVQSFTVGKDPDTIDNKEAIKNTIDELMKMGQALTAEQIREKIAQISQTTSSNTSSNNVIRNNINTASSNEVYSDINNISTSPVEPIATETNIKVQPEVESKVLEDEEEYKSESISTDKFSMNIKGIYAPEEKRNLVEDIARARIEREKAEEETNQVNTIPKQEEKFDDMYAQIFGKTIEPKKTEEEIEKENQSNAGDIVDSNTSGNIIEESEEYKDTIPYKFIGIAFNTYIILEIQKELYILDQHAAHERIMYEKVKKNYYSEEEKDSQLMLLPDVITLTHKEMDIARDNLDKFQKAGFVLEEFGENTIKLTGVPNICLDLDTKELFLETLDEINTVARTAKQEIEERFIATIACKAAVKANMALTEAEVTSLLDQLLKLPNPFTCPHGRPTAIKLSKTDIEKKFARRK